MVISRKVSPLCQMRCHPVTNLIRLMDSGAHHMIAAACSEPYSAWCMSARCCLHLGGLRSGQDGFSLSKLGPLCI